MRRRIAVSLVMLLGLTMMVGVAVAQTQQSAPPSPSAPSPGVQPPMTPPSGGAAPTPGLPKEKHIEGTVSKVDPLAKTVGVSTGLFGLLGATVQVADDTKIVVQGQPATLSEIKTGARVRASYEVRDGKNLGKLIDVTDEKLPAVTPPQGSTSKAGTTPTQ
jgi:hypothetical protein